MTAASSPAARSVESFVGSNPLVSRSMSPNCPSEAISVRFFWSMNLKFFTKLTKYSCFPKK